MGSQQTYWSQPPVFFSHYSILFEANTQEKPLTDTVKIAQPYREPVCENDFTEITGLHQ